VIVIFVITIHIDYIFNSDEIYNIDHLDTMTVYHCIDPCLKGSGHIEKEDAMLHPNTWVTLPPLCDED